MYEILAPAGDEKSFLSAINSGANAIYLGLDKFSARSLAENFDERKLQNLIKLAKVFGVKVYVAMNTLIKDGELNGFIEKLVAVHNLGADAIIIQDIFLGAYLKRKYPQITFHLSTQAGINNENGAKLAKKLGFSRVILARETELKEIEKITKIIETEVFIQGALCSCFSGNCYLSSFAGNNSGNRGLCKQPCRKKYSYNKKGFEDFKYRLSLSDLSVGEKIKILHDKGVVSFKIEGRMRSPEYVSSAVKYYNSIIMGEDEKTISQNLSDLKRTFNRNDYTFGYAFSENNIISDNIQGHIGEKVGEIVIKNNEVFCKSNQTFKKGCGFKIIRNFEEVGGAVFKETVQTFNDGFYLSTSASVKNGDGVYVTLDTSLQDKLALLKRFKSIELNLNFTVLKTPYFFAKVDGKTIEFKSDFVLQQSQKLALNDEQVKECFDKTDIYPFKIVYNKIDINGEIFMPKSIFNSLRRDFYQKIYEELSKIEVKQYKAEVEDFSFESLIVNNKTAVISCDFGFLNSNIDYAIFKPFDYNNKKEYRYFFNSVKNYAKNKFLYVPAFLNEQDEKIIIDNIADFDGIYGEGLNSVNLSKSLNKKLFCGTNFNVFNSVDLLSLKGCEVALSKELSDVQQKGLNADYAYALKCGDIKVMDFIYCPFKRECASCDKRDFYELLDEGKRKFLLRRFRLSKCYFELFNCAELICDNNLNNTLVDLTCIDKATSMQVLKNLKDKNKLKQIFNKYTFGHSNDGVN